MGLIYGNTCGTNEESSDLYGCKCLTNLGLGQFHMGTAINNAKLYVKKKKGMGKE